MELIFEDRKRRVIQGKEEINFSSYSAYHLVVVTARAKGEKQLSAGSTDDEDLIVGIDGKNFSKLDNRNALIDSPASFSGGKIHGLSKIVYFLVFLKGRNHQIILRAESPPGTATLEGLEVYAVEPNREFTLEVNQQAEDGDRRPWLTFALADLPLKNFSLELELERRFIDSDDVKVLVDGEIKRNHRNIFRKFWYFIASAFTGENQSETFSTNLPSALHYLELHADRLPLLRRVSLDFGREPSIPEVIPNVRNPKWTGNFDDDTTGLLLTRLIFGEAEGQPKEAKIGVSFTVLNRLKKKRQNWGFSVREVILKDNQYDGLWNTNTYSKVRDPLNGATEKTRSEWFESYAVAQSVLDGSTIDASLGATNFHSYKKKEDFPDWALANSYKVKLGDIYFYELER